MTAGVGATRRAREMVGGGHHEQPAGRIEVAGFAGVDGVAVRGHRRRVPCGIGREPVGMWALHRILSNRLAHGAEDYRCPAAPSDAVLLYGRRIGIESLGCPPVVEILGTDACRATS